MIVLSDIQGSECVSCLSGENVDRLVRSGWRQSNEEVGAIGRLVFVKWSFSIGRRHARQMALGLAFGTCGWTDILDARLLWLLMPATAYALPFRQKR